MQDVLRSLSPFFVVNLLGNLIGITMAIRYVAQRCQDRVSNIVNRFASMLLIALACVKIAESVQRIHVPLEFNIF